MIVAGFDLESTGLDVNGDAITELGVVVYCTASNSVLALYSSFINPPVDKLPLTEEIKELTGIQDEYLTKHGRTLAQALEYVERVLIQPYDVEYIVAHNGMGFDIPMLKANMKRDGIESSSLVSLPLIDTRHDLPFKREPKSRSLNHLAADFDFINPFKHRAVFDVLTMLRVMSEFDFEEVAKQSKIPWIVVRALVDYDDRQKAKDMRYSWEALGEEKFPKMWVKKIRENMLETEQKLSAEKEFKSVRIK